MPQITVRSTQGSGGDWTPLPKGTYDLTINSIKERTSGSGNPNLQVECSVADGPHAGKTANVWKSLVPKSGWALKALLDACGVNYNEQPIDEIDEESGKPLTELQFDTDELVGKTFTCDAVISEFEGKENNRFNNERPVGMTLPELKERNRQRRAEAEAAETAPQQNQQTQQRSTQQNQQRSTQPQQTQQRQPQQGNQRQPGGGSRRVQG